MAHKYRIETGTDATLSNLNPALSDTTFNRVLTDRDQTFGEQTDITGTVTGYTATVYAADTEARSGVETKLENVVADATKATIEHRHTWREYDDSRIADKTYYPHDRAVGLRTDPTIERDGWGTTITADTHHNGTEVSHTTTLTFDSPTDYCRQDRVVADTDGLAVLQGNPVGKPAETGVQPTAPPTPDGAVSVATVTVKEHIDRIPFGEINAAELVGEPSDRTTVYEK
jgi:hypothetical protein